MDPLAILQLAMTAWKSGGTIITFVRDFRAHIGQTREETPEEEAAFDAAIDAMDTTPWGKPDATPTKTPPRQ